MLRELIRLIEDTEGCMSIPELSRQLHAEPSAVEGMMQTLRDRGRLLVVDGEATPCEACGSREGCTLASLRNRKYVVAPRN